MEGHTCATCTTIIIGDDARPYCSHCMRDMIPALRADIDALTAERDELQAIIVAPPGLNEWSHDGDKITAIYSHRPAYAKSEADAKYLVRCHNHNLQMIHERECERDELQRRLDAVVAKISEAVVSDDDCVCSMLCHSAILAIAENE